MSHSQEVSNRPGFRPSSQDNSINDTSIKTGVDVWRFSYNQLALRILQFKLI